MSEDDMKFLAEVAHRAKDPVMMQSIIMSAVGGVLVYAAWATGALA